MSRANIKVQTLKKRADFLRISKDGKKASTKTFVMLATPNDVLRVGYTVSKRTSKLAVERNKIKRRLKAAVHEVFTLAVVQDYVIIGRRDILERNFKDLKGDLKYAVKKLSFQSPTEPMDTHHPISPTGVAPNFPNEKFEENYS